MLGSPYYSLGASQDKLMPFNRRERYQCELLLKLGLEEDLDDVGDITSNAVIAPERQSQALVIARQEGVVAGLECIDIMAGIYGKGLSVERLAQDGAVKKGTAIARIKGPTRSVLTVERTMLNLLGRLSGVATMTARYVAAVKGTKAKICDTRKTTPGWRYLEKYAVRVGGGTNHRIGLFDAILIKDNHLADLARHEEHPLAAAIKRSRESVSPETIVEIEVDSIAQLEEALPAAPDIVLLDNMSIEMLREAVEMRDRITPTVALEASGGVNLETVTAIAQTGVDRISVGALTHSAPVFDVALDDEPVNA